MKKDSDCDLGMTAKCRRLFYFFPMEDCPVCKIQISNLKLDGKFVGKMPGLANGESRYKNHNRQSSSADGFFGRHVGLCSEKLN